MMKKTVSALLAASVLFTSAPAFADSDMRYYKQHRSELITHEQAAKAALASVGGGHIEEVDFEYERGKALIEVEILKDGDEWDVVVDAKTGKVLSKRLDD
ncbi:MAG: PepSY domain-containing protein [Neisseria sp.]|nr:PepSY domain-containing protein [Neisseria sp.]